MKGWKSTKTHLPKLHEVEAPPPHNLRAKFYESNMMFVKHKEGEMFWGQLCKIVTPNETDIFWSRGDHAWLGEDQFVDFKDVTHYLPPTYKDSHVRFGEN